MNYDLVVVGAGPAGMSAAIAAATAGVKVAIIDENPVTGGKLLGQLHEEPNGWWIGKGVAADLHSQVETLGVTTYRKREVWGIYPAWKVMLNTGEVLKTKYVLIATGAAERAVPVPGWTTPGVMAIGAAQVLTNYHRVKPGKKVTIIGVDPLSLTVSRELTMAGVKVAGIFLPPSSVFCHEKTNPSSAISYLSSMSHLAPSRLLRIAGKLGNYPFVQRMAAKYYPAFGVRAWKVPLLLRKTIIEIVGDEQVTAIKTATVDEDGKPVAGSEKEVEVDCVCISGGLYPLSELANAAGCESVYIEELGGRVPLHGADMETTQSGIFVAGNITGIESAKIAMKQGELAGTVISSRLGLLDNSKMRISNARENVERERDESLYNFQPDIKSGRKRLAELWQEREIDSRGGDVRHENG